MTERCHDIPSRPTTPFRWSSLRVHSVHSNELLLSPAQYEPVGVRKWGFLVTSFSEFNGAVEGLEPRLL